MTRLSTVKGRFRKLARKSLFDQVGALRSLLPSWRWWLVYRPHLGQVGRGSLIQRPLLLMGPQYIKMGANVRFRQLCRIEARPVIDSRVPVLEIGDGTTFEQGVHIVCVNRITIGARCSFSAFCCITDLDHPFDPTVPHVASGPRIGDRASLEDLGVTIGDDCFIGIGVAILPGVTIGRGCVIGANSVVTRDLPAGSIAAGMPARVIRTWPEHDRSVEMRPSMN